MLTLRHSGCPAELAVRKAVYAAAAGLLLVLSVGVQASAAGCPNRQSPGFRTYLPDCRAYEMVSPPYKQGYSAEARGISNNGSQVLVESQGNFLTSTGTLPESTGFFGHSYRIARTEEGWQAQPVDAPSSMFRTFEVQSMSSDFGSSLLLASTPMQSDADIYLDPAEGPVKFVGPGAPPGAKEIAVNFMGASENLSHTLFIVRSANHGLEEEHLWPGDTTLGERKTSLYEYAGTRNTEPSLVGVSDEHEVKHISESHLISNCGTVFGSSPNPGGDAYNAVSANGDTVFFTAKECGGTPSTDELYARIDRDRTVAISEPTAVPGRICTGICAEAQNTPAMRKPGIFAGASLDGSTVFFTTGQPLVDADKDNSVDLYEADVGAGAVTRLAQVSGGDEGDVTPGTGAEVLGVARISEDGSHAYFVAKGALTGANKEGKKPIIGEPNLYVAARECAAAQTTCENPTEHTSFIATLSASDEEDWSPDDQRPVQATPDGRFLVFQSSRDLTPDQAEQVEAGQVFEYAAQTGKLVRVSRGQHGYNQDGNSNIYRATVLRQSYTLDGPSGPFNNLAVSADGSDVFFSSEDALTPQAVEGIRNVYESHEGQTDLISDGHDVQTVNEESATELIGTDESGRDVFFRTTDRLVPQDTDIQVDVYDARLNGGFPPQLEPAGCSADSCQGSESPTSTLPESASTTVTPEITRIPAAGSAPQKAKPKPHKRTKKHKKAARKHKGKSKTGSKR